jgi:hypothetical protein
VKSVSADHPCMGVRIVRGVVQTVREVVKIVRGVVKTVYRDDHDCPSPNVCADHCTGFGTIVYGICGWMYGFVVGTVRNW